MVFGTRLPSVRTFLLTTFAYTVFARQKSEASEWKYPFPPWQFPAEAWGFLGTHPINGTHPPDFVPDPAITYTAGTVISAFSIQRHFDSFWGPFDTVVIIGSSARVGDGPVKGRITQAFTSALPPVEPSDPLHVPFKLAKFVWTTAANGARDVKVYSPPTSTAPVIHVSGLFAIPFLCLPVPFGFFPAFGLTSFLQSVTDSFDPVGPITGHTLGNIDWKACMTTAAYASIETAPPVSLDGGFVNLGFFVNGTVEYQLQPYP
eukprot:jgi/Botrbrau1/12760/Bobra.67_1s0119.1